MITNALKEAINGMEDAVIAVNKNLGEVSCWKLMHESDSADIQKVINNVTLGASNNCSFLSSNQASNNTPFVNYGNFGRHLSPELYYTVLDSDIKLVVGCSTFLQVAKFLDLSFN